MIIESLKNKLNEMQIKHGDAIYVTSDIGKMGIPLDLKENLRKFGSSILLKSYIETLIDAVGPNGTIVMPTFTYSACKNEIFSPDETASTVGVLSEYFRLLPGTKRTDHTIFSVSYTGNLPSDILSSYNSNCFGSNSIFEYFCENDFKFLLLGLDMIHGSTNVYHSEQNANVTYRYNKTFKGLLKKNEIINSVDVNYFVRDYNVKYKDEWSRLQNDSIKDGITKYCIYNKSPIICYHANEIDLYIMNKLNTIENYLISI